MGTWGFLKFIKSVCFCLFLVSKTTLAAPRNIGQIYPGFRGAQMNWVGQNGLFLQSNNSNFAFGFYTTLDVTFFVLVVYHIRSSRVIWTANRGLLVRNFDDFVFDNNGNAYLESGNSVVWSSNTLGKGVTLMELQDNGNLVMLDANGNVVWDSYSHPSDTLLPGQVFREGMRLRSLWNQRNITNFMEIRDGDLILYFGLHTPQQYWSMEKDSRKMVKKIGGKVSSASIVSNSWRFYDGNQSLVWEFAFSKNTDPNVTWSVFLGSDGSLSFYGLHSGSPAILESTYIPLDPCSKPEPCDPYSVCNGDKSCQCPSVLRSEPNCTPNVIGSYCNGSKKSGDFDLLNVGDPLNYFALGFVMPVLKSDLDGCKKACLGNCSCNILFFENSSGNCFFFDEIGSFRQRDLGSSGFITNVKVLADKNGGGSSGQKHVILIVFMVVLSALVIASLVFLGWVRCRQRDVKLLETPQESQEEDMFLDSISGMPTRFTYNELQIATKNFSVKVGQGGFGSVYKGVTPDGMELAVKKLEGIGQGKKEFRSEVSIIGSIHHIHLVKLRGFCSEGTHRLLVYEYMSNGSLDRWIFNNEKNRVVLDWETRFNIALGTAKGLAYLHEDCDVKIVHCDIKPENVLLDDHFSAKVSDFGLAKLMNREQSHVFTTLRGTRGYLAPEWLTNHAISEKSDVFSFGMVLLEIIGGRKNYDPVEENSEKAHFPSYAFKMMMEGRLREIIDSRLEIEEDDDRIITAMRVALWCIQDEMYLRPPMSQVVQMLEGAFDVPPPPNSSQMISHLYTGFWKSMGNDDGSSRTSGYNSGAILSEIQLSGPR